MFHIVLVHPEIPPNTGNVIRLAANTGARLHLVEPLGFTMDDRQLRRAGLDYHELPTSRCTRTGRPARRAGGHRLFAFSTRGTRNYAGTEFRVGDAFVFGPETKGLAHDMLEQFPADMRLRLPMLAGNRSLNLSNAVAVVRVRSLASDRLPGLGLALALLLRVACEQLLDRGLRRELSLSTAFTASVTGMSTPRALASFATSRAV